jgi:hypothetical protein
MAAAVSALVMECSCHWERVLSMVRTSYGMKRTCSSSGQQDANRKHAPSLRSVGYANWLAGAANP